MSFFQTNVWNNIFRYAYPLAFIGSIAYGMLAIVQTDLATTVGNPKIAFAINIFFGLCGVLALAAYASADVSGIDTVTQYIGLNANETVSSVQKN